MAKAYVSEFTGILSGTIQIPSDDPIRTQVVDFTSGVAATANVFTDATRFVRVNVDATCSTVGGLSAPTATTSDLRMSANNTEYFPAEPGQKRSFISNT